MITSYVSDPFLFYIISDFIITLETFPPSFYLLEKIESYLNNLYLNNPPRVFGLIYTNKWCVLSTYYTFT